MSLLKTGTGRNLLASKTLKSIFFAWTAILLLFGSPESSQAKDKALANKIGQMLMVGFRGLEVNKDSAIIQDIAQGRVGGVILFDYDIALDKPERNIKSPEQLKAVTSDLQPASEEPLFIAVDQEGGQVSRLKEKHGFSPGASQARLGRRNDPELTAKNASRTAETLARMGINLNLAPVVDLNVNPDNPVIGSLERSFSNDPDKVALHARQVIQEHRKKGVLTALKHFPGHGSSSRDSHQGFTDISKSWSKTELEPFKEILQTVGADMIMTAHVFNSRLDPKWPASLSSRILNDLLRLEMGFDGVIISDDMQMGAIRKEYDLETALERTVLAGTDIIVFGNNLVYEPGIAQKATQIIEKLVQKDRIPASRIHNSFDRIMESKDQLTGKGD